MKTIVMMMLAVMCCAGPAMALEGVIKTGAGSHAADLPAGAKRPPAEIYKTENAKGAMPTNDWWSSLVFLKLSERQYAHPLAVQCEAGGLRVFYADKITGTKDAIFGFMPDRSGDDLIIGHTAIDTFTDARVDGWSDWFVSAQQGTAQAGVRFTYGHGSPFVYATYTGGNAKITITKPYKVWAVDEKTATLALTINGKHYVLFPPTGSTWNGIGEKTLRCESNGKGYFSVALLPDDKQETLAMFQKCAHAHVVDSKVAWSFDEKTSAVHTTYTITTKAMEGDEKGTLMALYPHQWRNTTGAVTALRYNSVRGSMVLAQGNSFATKMTFHGVLPCLPDAKLDRTKITALLKREHEVKFNDFKDTYWEGKMLGRLASVIPIAEQAGDEDAAELLRKKLRVRLEDWFTANDAGGKVKTKGLFAYEKNWGTLIGYPASYGSDVELNDHHFHYGYFIKAAAEIARTDPAWASDAKWGAMIKLLIRDIACADRDDKQFPFLRNFDIYAGHTWASGHARFGDGNNNESSSEAMNAWCGMILLGQATGDTALRDLGIYLYTTEMNAIHEYWFNSPGENFPPGYPASVVTMVWGGKGANATWFGNKPPIVHGINFLPIHGGSLYLGIDPKYAAKNYDALVAENRSDQFRDWADINWMYRALSDADVAVRLLDGAGGKYAAESGNAPVNAHHWIHTLAALGQVDRSITADYPVYAVFKKGGQTTHAAYVMTSKPLTITFSDGAKIQTDKPGWVMLQSSK